MPSDHADINLQHKAPAMPGRKNRAEMGRK